MDRERWLVVSPYLDQALDMPATQLDAWLRELESSDSRIAADVRRLLAVQANEGFSSFLNGQAAEPPGDARYAHPGELIGNHRVLHELGRGGMAVVYLAERADDHFEQQVALKILRFGAESGEARRHFAQERQILASLNHPAIARLIDGGFTALGLPYLAMEYVEGVPIDRYCDEQRLSIDDRLRLFVKVAEAVQYAHRHLIVHRDLKPSNIVVTHEGAVKLLDFGIAKLLEPNNMAHAAPPTRDVVQLMTPEYASPEQARGDPITTATDVYQLGRLLYELLTGRAPYDLRDRNPVDTLRVICESEPMRPSTAATTPNTTDAAEVTSLAAIGTARGTTPDRLRRVLRGDLEAILLMALRKEPERRYSSVGPLTEDIVRYLEGLPVSAYKGVWIYRTRKFVRRHAASVSITSTAVCFVVFLIVWYTIQLANERDRADKETLRARREAATASQVSEFITSVFRGSSSRVAAGDTTARELLDRGAARIETELASQPEVQGRLLNVIGDVYAQYEIDDKAQPLLERALAQNTRLFGERSREVGDTKIALARLARNRSDYSSARHLIEEALAIRTRTLGPRHIATADALSDLGFILYLLGESKNAALACERAIDIYTPSVSKDDERVLSAVNRLALALTNAGELTRARAYFEQLVPQIERSLGPEHQHFARALANLAIVRVELEDYEGFEQQVRRALAIFERVYGKDHSSVAISLTLLGIFFYETGRLHEAISMFERAIAMHERLSGSEHSLTASVQIRLARVFRARGDFKTALSHQQSALEIRRKSLGASHFLYAAALEDYGETQMEIGNLRLAASALNDALSIQRRSLPAGHYDIATALVAHGLLLTRTGMLLEADTQIREAISYYKRALPPGHRLLAAANSALGECLLAQGRVLEAEALLLDSDRQLENRLHYDRRLSLQRLIHLYELKGDRQSAEHFRNQLAAFERKARA